MAFPGCLSVRAKRKDFEFNRIAHQEKYCQGNIKFYLNILILFSFFFGNANIHLLWFFFVKIGNHYCVQTAGIPQGSILSTLLCW